MLRGTRNKFGASQPLLSERKVSSKVGAPFQCFQQLSRLRICDAISYFLWVNTQTMGDVDPRPTPSVNRYAVRFNAKENARFLPMFEQSGAINKDAFIKNFSFPEVFQGLCFR